MTPEPREATLAPSVSLPRLRDDACAAVRSTGTRAITSGVREPRMGGRGCVADRVGHGKTLRHIGAAMSAHLWSARRMTCATDQGSNPAMIATADSSPFDRRRGPMPLLAGGDASPIISPFYSDLPPLVPHSIKTDTNYRTGLAGIRTKLLSCPSPHIYISF